MSNTFVGMPAFPEAAKIALADTQLRRNLAHATRVDPHQARRRGRRAATTGRSCGWPGRRSRTGRCGTSTATCEQFEAAAPAAGAQVHWARDGDEANADRRRPGAGQAGADEVVKVKSMATQEMGMNEALAEAGIAALETDLAELIVQLNDDLPSHILVPAIHRNRAEIREIFLREMPGAPRRPHRRAAGAGRGGPDAPAAQVPVGEGRHLGRELRDRRDRDAGRRRVRGQRADVPDPARDADQRGRRREDRADVAATWRCSCSCCRARRPGSG